MLAQPRGELSSALFAALRTGAALPAWPGPGSEDDAQLTLWTLYELHYRGFDGVDPEREWDTDLLRLRAELERRFEQVLQARWQRTEWARGTAGEVTIAQLEALLDGHRGLSVARFVQRGASRDQVVEVLRHRSVYHLKEADPTSWVVPRLGTRTKAALIEIQFDEYGAGDPNRLHQHLFRRGLEAAGLGSEPTSHVDQAPVEILAMNNAMSLFGLHRRLRGAVLGHLAAFEATSSLPCRQLAQGLRRLDFPEELAAYYDEHVEADAVHEQLALRVCAAFFAEEPAQRGEVLFGAFSCLDLEDRYARQLLGGWDAA